MLNNSASSTNEPVTTGRFLILFAEGKTKSGAQVLKDAGGLSVSSTAELATSEVNPNVGNNEVLVYHNLGVAVANTELNNLETASSVSVADGPNPILTIEPEMVLSAAPQEVGNVPPIDNSLATWGLSATKVIDSKFSGRGIKVAILDTGLNLNHPDFTNRKIISHSFVQGEKVQDGHGHGTHCTGTACGSRQPTQLPRYGIAYQADIYIGKVLDNEKGSGSDATIIAGIEWALNNGCQIISMSISGRSIMGQPFSQVYEALAKRVLQQGTLIIAAAGNDSWRNLINNPIFNPVGRPANCPSIMAVGAVDSQSQIAWFSNRGFSPDGGEIDIVGPGVAVHSSWLLPQKYNTIDGTSMATPHVAGIAALLAEANPQARGKELWNLLTQTARPLRPILAEDAGAGLVQAP